MSKRKRVREELEFKAMAPYFDQPVEEAGRRLGRTPLEIRTRCRELGFSWPRGDIDRFKKQVKSSELLLQKCSKAPSDPAVVATLLAQISTAKQKIEILYKDPSGCDSKELELRRTISRPYKRRNHNVGVLTESEKERYRTLFAPVGTSSSSSSSSVGAFMAFFDRMSTGSGSGSGSVSGSVTAESNYSAMLQNALRQTIVEPLPIASGECGMDYSPPNFSLGSYFDEERERDLGLKEPTDRSKEIGAATHTSSTTNTDSDTGSSSYSSSDPDDDSDYDCAATFATPRR